MAMAAHMAKVFHTVATAIRPRRPLCNDIQDATNSWCLLGELLSTQGWECAAMIFALVAVTCHAPAGLRPFARLGKGSAAAHRSIYVAQLLRKVS